MISVQAIVLSLESLQIRRNHNRLKSLSFFFSPALRSIFQFIVPSFFALSGFLVAGSLERNTLPAFLTLRAVRIFPALTIEVVISAILIGPLFTVLPLKDYFSSPLFARYFFNLIGHIQYVLPGVFEALPASGIVNQQLWTVPIELECYLILAGFSLLAVTRWPWLFFALLTSCCCAVVLKEFFLGAFPPVNRRPPDNILVLSFLSGIALYLLRDKIPFSGLMLCCSALLTWIFLDGVRYMYLAPIPIAYTTVYFGLNNPPRNKLVDGADYSYGMYLYGFPVQQVVASLFPEYRFWQFNLVVSVIVAALIASLSWRFIERPIHRIRHRFVHFVESLIQETMRRVKRL